MRAAAQGALVGVLIGLGAFDLLSLIIWSPVQFAKGAASDTLIAKANNFAFLTGDRIDHSTYQILFGCCLKGHACNEMLQLQMPSEKESWCGVTARNGDFTMEAKGLEGHCEWRRWDRYSTLIGLNVRKYTIFVDEFSQFIFSGESSNAIRQRMYREISFSESPRAQEKDGFEVSDERGGLSIVRDTEFSNKRFFASRPVRLVVFELFNKKPWPIEGGHRRIGGFCRGVDQVFGDGELEVDPGFRTIG